MVRRVMSREILQRVAMETLAGLSGDRVMRDEASALSAIQPTEIWGIGKAAAQMVSGALAGGCAPARGCFVLTTKGAVGDTRLLASAELHEAGHPHPDERGVRATESLLARARKLSSADRVLVLLSGGASALLAAPIDGCSLATVKDATALLVRSGASIQEINCIRRCTGRALGGRLARAVPCETHLYALSDILDDDLATLGSGPFTASPTDARDALAIARRFGVSAEILAALEKNPAARPPAEDDPCFLRVHSRVVAGPRTLLANAAVTAGAHGLIARPLLPLLSGDIEAVASRLAAESVMLADREVIVAVGEPTVRVRGDARGGRMQHLALLLAERLAGARVTVLCCASDGSDGGTDHAGAIVDGRSAERFGTALRAAIVTFRSYEMWRALDEALVTGPSGTNLTDLVLIARDI